MRLLLAVLAVVLTVAAYLEPAAAKSSKSIKKVEVTNFPDPQNVTGAVEVTNLPPVQDVNVVNPTPVAPPARFQLVGFTNTLYTGNLGGIFGGAEKCQLEFPTSRMCALGEVQDTTTLPTLPDSVAWVNRRNPEFPDESDEAIGSSGDRSNCSLNGVPVGSLLVNRHWSRDVPSNTGSAVDPAGALVRNIECSETHSIACCAQVP